MEAMTDRAFWGRMVESAVGAHLANAELSGVCEVFYWREVNHEVDFVVKSGKFLLAIEVKCGRAERLLPGMAKFRELHHSTRTLLVGGDGVSLDEFLLHPVEYWLGD